MDGRSARVRASSVAFVSLSVALAVEGRTQILINEVRYDPPGSDAGGEYVELMNVSPAAVALDGDWVLERGNGASPDAWTAFWTGAGEEIPPGGWLAIGDDPRASVQVTPSLQNGPDACRLLRRGGVVDLVGWGAHEHAGYAEGAPAPDEPSQLLARRPDGADTDVNARDFVSTTRETPGARNFDALHLEIRPGVPPLIPLLPEPAERFRITFEARSEGLEPLPGAAGVRVEGRGSWRLGTPLPPGGVRDGGIDLPALEAGTHAIALSPFGDGIAGASRVVAVRIGLGPLVISEVQPRATDAEPEWVEIDARGAGPDPPAGWRILDGGGGAAELPPVAGVSFPVVLTAARDRLLGRYPEMDPGSVWELPLPTLNDRDETLLLVDAEDRVSDALRFDAPPSGTSLERVNPSLPSRDPAAWAVSPFGPTPQRPNGAHADPPETETLHLSPRVVGTSGAEIAFHLGERSGALALVVVDAAGRTRGTILAREGTARGGLRWDGRVLGERLPPGLYVLVATLDVGDRRIVRRTAFAVDWSVP